MIRTAWDKTRKQGSVGFNKYAAKQMLASGLKFKRKDLACHTGGGADFTPSPPQQIINYLIHPDTSIERFLVVHRTGLGKTYAMILALDNYFADPRARVIIFPTLEAESNFYRELMKFPNRYRDYVTAVTGLTYSPALTRGNLDTIKDTLELKGKIRHGRFARGGEPIAPGSQVLFPGGPLRAMRYSLAGGRTVLKPKSSGGGYHVPANPLFKGWDGTNPYSNTITLMDEFHFLAHPPKGDVRQEGEDNQRRLRELRKALMSAKNILMLGFTATPLVVGAKDLELTLEVVKGDAYRDAPTNEGFVSYFQSLPTEVFAEVTTGTPPEEFVKMRKVTLPDDSTHLKIYLKKQKEYAKLPKPEMMTKLHPYATTGLYYVGNPGGYEPSTGSYRKLIETYEDAAIKLDTVVEDVLKSKKKTLVLISSKSGFKQMRAIWHHKAAQFEGADCPKACWVAHEPGKTTTAARRKQIERERNLFNSAENADGKLMRVVIAEAEAYEVAVSFLGIRVLKLVDVPMSWASYMQRLGRVLRYCGHEDLPASKRNVALEMYVTRSNLLEETTDEYFVKIIKKKNTEMMDAMGELREMAVDKEILKMWEAPVTFKAQMVDMTVLRLNRWLGL